MHKNILHLVIINAVSLQLLQPHVQLDHFLVMMLLTILAATVPPPNV